MFDKDRLVLLTNVSVGGQNLVLLNYRFIHDYFNAMFYLELLRFGSTFIVLHWDFLGINFLITCSIGKASIYHLEGVIINYYGALGILVGVLNTLTIH